MSRMSRNLCFVIYYCQVYLLFYSTAQDCSNGTACTPQYRELDSSSINKLSVSSTCNGTYKSLSPSVDTPCPNTNVAALVDTIVTDLGLDGIITEGNFDTFWMSQNTKTSNGGYNEEFILVNFTDVFLIRTIELTFKNILNPTPIDMRPIAMEFQGFDGTNWITWRYFAKNCSTSYNIQISSQLFGLSDLCESRPDLTVPSSGNMEVAYRPVEEFGDDFFIRQDIQSYFMTSAVKLKFKTPPLDDFPYYVVADLQITYQCACYGHASQCGGPYGGECVCQHSTSGKNCQMCLPLYNNVAWQMASSSNSFQCQPCDCRGRSTTCQYNAIENSGDCINCLYGTSGKFCDTCSSGYYLNPAGNSSAPPSNCTGFNGISTITYGCLDVCIPCSCSTSGSTDSASCDRTGQCPCKSNVGGLMCNVCKDGFFNLDGSNFQGCSACNCNVNGMLTCDKLNGTCVCKNNTFGSNCDSCQTGYYNLIASNPNGCSLCDCDVGASTNKSCDFTTGQCSCKSGTMGRDCRTLAVGTFGASLDFYTFEAEFSVNVSNNDIIERPGGGNMTSTFTGRGFLTISPPKSTTFNVQVTSSGVYQLVIRYESPASLPVVATLTPVMAPTTQPSIGNIICPNSASYILSGMLNPADKSGSAVLASSACLSSNLLYQLKLDAQSGTNPGTKILLDSVVLMPAIENLTSFLVSNDIVKAQMRQCLSLEQKVDYTGRINSGCPSLDYSLMVDLGTGSFACSCDPVGSYNNSCSPLGGQCPCKPNVFLRNCSQCSVNSYGFGGPNGCIDCACNPSGSVTLRCNETGLCQCRPNVVGDKCDRCIDKNFGLISGNGCQACQCTGSYVVNDSCTDSGQCFCKPGVAGLHCDSCSPRFYGLTSDGCSSCGCNSFGSTGSACDQVRGACSCRSAVQGSLCDTCKPGYFGLGPYSEDGCIKCYCSGKSTNCSSATGWYQSYATTGSLFGASWTGVDLLGQYVPFNIGYDFQNNLQVLQVLNNRTDDSPLYFSSPMGCSSTTCFTGNKATSYGQHLNFTLSFIISSLSTNASTPPPSNPGSFVSYPNGDVIIKGVSVNYTIVAKLPNLPGSVPTSYSLRINESSWFKNDLTSAIRPTYEEMIHLLYDVQSILIRAKFSNAIDSFTSLFNVRLGYGVNYVTGDNIPIANIEQCICPPRYEGRYCEKCSARYKKVNNQCVDCNCNSHDFPGTTCDPVTGKCNCSYHTTGDNCELCAPGYYGDATLKLQDSCKACMCPGNVNDPQALVHSSKKSCNTTSASFYTCACDVGYTGSHCDVCADGFFGVPNNVGINNGKCQPCFCGGYPDKCNSTDGTCFECGGNTTGIGCSQCMPYTYTSDMISTKSCQACLCNMTGSIGCFNQTGQCICKPGISSDTSCSSCMTGYYNYSGDGCKQCNCNVAGTVGSSTNCSDNGLCSCKNNFIGAKCDLCFGFTFGPNCDNNCSCNTNYTINNNQSCSTGGQCQCLDGFTGFRCDQCIPTSGASFTGITDVATPIFPYCSSGCDVCFRSLAQKASYLGQNTTAMNDLTVAVIRTSFNNLASIDVRTRLTEAEKPLNLSNDSILQLQSFNGQAYNISMFNVPARTNTYESDLNGIDQELSTYQLELNLLSSVNREALNTGDSETPVLSLTNVNRSLNAIISDQTTFRNGGEISYNSIQTVNSLVQTLPNSIASLQSRVAVVNSTMSRATATLDNSDLQMSAINVDGIRSKILLDGLLSKTTTSNVNRLAEDLNITDFYINMASKLNKGSQDTINAYRVTFDSLKDQFSPSGNMSSFANAAQLKAQTAANLALQFCDSTQSSNLSVVNSMSSLFAGFKQLSNSSLSQSIQNMNSMQSTSLDLYSFQIGPLVNSISNSAFSSDIAANISRYADNSSALAQALTGSIDQAINQTNLAKSKLDLLQTELNSATTKDSQSRICLYTATVQSMAIKSIITSVSLKANQTQDAARSTVDAINNATSLYDPVKKNFSDISDNVASSYRSMQLSNNTLNSAQSAHIQNSNDLATLNTNLSLRMNSFNTWMTTRSSVESCINDLWASLNALNTPIKLTDLVTQTNNQVLQIQQLTTDIKNLETEMNSLLTTVNALTPGSATCKDAV